MSSAIFRNASFIGLGKACLSALPLTLVLAAGAGYLCAQNPATPVSVDANANRHPINPNVYGVGMFMDSNDNVLPADLAAVNAPFHRFGATSTAPTTGNRMPGTSATTGTGKATP